MGVPDSPNVSLVATNSCGTGLFLTSTLATLSPNPPRKLCSSAVTTQPVLFTDSNIDDSSRGFIVWILIKSVLMPFYLILHLLLKLPILDDL